MFALAPGGCGSAEDEGSSPPPVIETTGATGATDSQGSTGGEPVYDGFCPLSRNDVADALGGVVDEVTPVDDSSFSEPPICEFRDPGAVDGEVSSSATFTPLGPDAPLEEVCGLYEIDPGEGGEATSREDWGPGACQLINATFPGGAIAVAVFAVDGAPVSLSISVPADSGVDTQEALDRLVAIIGPS